MSYRCSCGSISKVRFRDFKNGRRCAKCKFNKLADLFKTPIDDVRAFFAKHGCVLLAEEYKDNRTKIPYVCKCGKVASVTYSNFQKSQNCWGCGVEKKSGDKCHLWNPDREAVARNKRYRKVCGNILARALTYSGFTKTDNTHVLLGYHPIELQKHIREHKLYCGETDMNIDHIFPIKAFMDYQIFDLKLINALENLQPLYGIANQEKADKYDRTEFEAWLAGKGISVTQPN